MTNVRMKGEGNRFKMIRVPEEEQLRCGPAPDTFPCITERAMTRVPVMLFTK